MPFLHNTSKPAGYKLNDTHVILATMKGQSPEDEGSAEKSRKEEVLIPQWGGLASTYQVYLSTRCFGVMP